MPKIRNIIIFIIIAIAFILIYIFFIKPSPQEASLVSLPAGAALPNIDGSASNTAANPNSLISKDFLILFSSVKDIKLNDAIFSDPAFNNLHDSSITLIPDGTEGRPNPFAQFGNDGILLPALPTPIIPTPIKP
ncbi:MAG: hypothetical protein V1484_00870 [bacterium]